MTATLVPAASPVPSLGRVGLCRIRVNAYRVYAILLIIWAHCESSLGPSSAPGFRAVEHALNIVGHVAIPFFFVIAGNHLGPHLMRTRGLMTARPYIRQLARLLAISSVIYFVADSLMRGHLDDGPAIFGQHLRRLLADPIGLVLHGTSLHLWFLVALIFTILLAAVVMKRHRLRTFVLVAGCLYVVGLLGGPYATVLGWPGGDSRAVSFIQSPVFFALGTVLADPRTRTGTGAAWAVFAGGCALHAAEVYWLSTTQALSPFALGMLGGTLFMALGIGLVALLPAPSTLDRFVASAGALTPVVYLGHVLFLSYLRPFRYVIGPTLFRVLFPVAVAVTSFAAASLLRRAARQRRARRRRRADHERAGS